jgi:hypothetical protein
MRFIIGHGYGWLPEDEDEEDDEEVDTPIFVPAAP